MNVERNDDGLDCTTRMAADDDSPIAVGNRERVSVVVMRWAEGEIPVAARTNALQASENSF